MKSRPKAVPTAMTGNEPRAKKSRGVSLGLVVFVASSLAACGPRDYKRCVDQDGRVVGDQPCQGAATGGAAYGGTGGYGGPGYRWYYGGYGLRVGDRVGGGSYTARAGTSYRSSTVRGGFGRSAVAHASGGHA